MLGKIIEAAINSAVVFIKSLQEALKDGRVDKEEAVVVLRNMADSLEATAKLIENLP